MRRPLFSHVDLRVRDRATAIEYYDRLLGALGLQGSYGDEWSEYKRDLAEGEIPQWIAFTEDDQGRPGDNRVALAAESKEEVDRMAALLSSFGSRAIEGPEYAYGPNYYAVFFEDPDGNRLEICYVT
jgi:catechol 2,3-dioxygenase-like lactoylglutathione lyase family enzyme